ncbi:hypothetical protein [Paenibacillus lentus]|uniref:Uncharacterized protein n=1 Tax=Paenibacillus lentus TaxID=1338368 RepID=A0A3Q8S9B1_9BACL|nr:hypothetical protein [Paenibacillus lentus]AZK45318.1 hypothetical protein EIM92_03120 [Paenibacillus lentus]
MQLKVDPDRILGLEQGMKHLKRVLENDVIGLYRELSQLVSSTRSAYPESNNVQSSAAELERALGEIRRKMESISDQMDAKASTLRWAAGQYHASEKQFRSLTGMARKFTWNKAGLLSRWAQTGLQQGKGALSGFLNNPLSLINRLKEMLLTMKGAALSQQLKPFEEDPRIASLLHIMNNGSVDEQGWAQDQLSKIAHAISEIGRSQVAYNIYEKYGNTAYMEEAKLHAEMQRSLLRQLGIDERYFVGTDLRSQFTGSPISACDFNPLLTDGSKMPDQGELRFVIAAGLVNEKYRNWAKLNYNEIELAVKRAEAVREFERQVEEYRRLHGPPMELPDGTPITPDNKENETTYNYFMEKIYDPNKPDANLLLEYYVWLEDTYGMTEWRKKVVMADRVVSEFVFALVEETVMGVIDTAEFAFKLVVDPENTVEGVVDSVAYLVENPEVLVEAAKTMYKNFNEGTPEERAQMLGSAASYLIPGVTLTKAGKANKVVDGLQSTAKAADKAKDINKLFEAPKSIMDLLPFTILETSTGHRMIVPKDFSNNLNKHDSPDLGGSGGRLEGKGKVELSLGNIKHFWSGHSFESFSKQIPYLLKVKSIEEVEKQLSNVSFFNKNLSKDQVVSQVERASNEAVAKGITHGQYSTMIDGELITVAFDNGLFQTAWGSHKYKLSDFGY